LVLIFLYRTHFIKLLHPSSYSRYLSILTMTLRFFSWPETWNAISNEKRRLTTEKNKVRLSVGSWKIDSQAKRDSQLRSLVISHEINRPEKIHILGFRLQSTKHYLITAVLGIKVTVLAPSLRGLYFTVCGCEFIKHQTANNNKIKTHCCLKFIGVF